jgi:hypothetical protein
VPDRKRDVLFFCHHFTEGEAMKNFICVVLVCCLALIFCVSAEAGLFRHAAPGGCSSCAGGACPVAPAPAPVVIPKVEIVLPPPAPAVCEAPAACTPATCAPAACEAAAEGRRRLAPRLAEGVRRISRCGLRIVAAPFRLLRR